MIDVLSSALYLAHISQLFSSIFSSWEIIRPKHQRFHILLIVSHSDRCRRYTIRKLRGFSCFWSIPTAFSHSLKTRQDMPKEKSPSWLLFCCHSFSSGFILSGMRMKIETENKETNIFGDNAVQALLEFQSCAKRPFPRDLRASLRAYKLFYYSLYGQVLVLVLMPASP